MTRPFQYPRAPHVRRHGPRGYDDYASFRPWLRDEFTFRCAYCLKREQWGLVRATFDLDHFVPVCCDPNLPVQYVNLIYSCASCNARKRMRVLPDPLRALLRKDIRVSAKGKIKASSRAAQRIVLLLDLDGPDYTEFRRTWIEIIALARKYNPDLFQRLIGFPDELPDLSLLKPPGGNSRPDGVEQSAFVRRQRGTLPATC